MSTTPNQKHDDAVNRFIELANELKDSDASTPIVSAGLTTAACIYATYVTAGNDGFLQPAGVDKLCDAYRKQLEFIQQRKREELKAQGHDISAQAPVASGS